MLEASGELILVNNGSDDNTEEVMYLFRKNAPFPIEIVNEPRPGLGRARNAGILKAKADTLVFTDDDCYLAAGYLLKASKIFESNNFHYCGGRILLYDETDAMFIVNYFDKTLMIYPYSAICPGQISGCNMVISRKVIDKIGLFDPMFGPGTNFSPEDADYLTRASLAGFTGTYLPELVVYHHHGRKPRTIDGLIKYYAYGRGAFYIKFALMGKTVSLLRSIQLFRTTKDYILPPNIKTSSYFIWKVFGGMHYFWLWLSKKA
jgi:GT2 family glycosyltransferase